MSHQPLHARLAPEPQVLRNTFAGYPSGVAAISCRVDSVNEVLVASSFTVGVSLDPPLVTFAVQNGSRAWSAMRGAPTIGVSVFGEEHGDVCRRLAGGAPERRFDGIEHHVASNKAVYLLGAPAWLECVVWNEVPAGDHTIVILEIHGLFSDPDLEPLVWHRSSFRRLEPRAESPR